MAGPVEEDKAARLWHPIPGGGNGCFWRIIGIQLMLFVNAYLSTLPFDLYEMHLVRLIVETGSFTRAAQRAGLTQSAITRQVQGVEQRLGTALFERTTRKVALTAAGELFYERTRRIADEVLSLTDELQSGASPARTLLRVGLSNALGLAYLPGFFVQFRRLHPASKLAVQGGTNETLLSLLANREIDLAIVDGAFKLPAGLRVCRSFNDPFTAVVPATETLREDNHPKTAKALFRGTQHLPYIALSSNSGTGRALREWLRNRGVTIEPAMELDNFDLIINLVALGLGRALVPTRATALYLHRRKIRKVPLKHGFARQISVVARKSLQPHPALEPFIEQLLFS